MSTIRRRRVNGHPLDVSITLQTATSYTTSLSATSGAIGASVTLTFTPNGAWPVGETITPTVSGLSGSFSPTTINASGTGAVTCTFTPSAAGTATLSSTTSPTLTNTTGAQSYTASAGALLLDNLTTTIKAAYSCRKLRGAYSGAAIRVQRADGSQSDIGFTANGDLDTTALTTFTGTTTGSTGQVVTWYDQSGNGYNLTNSTLANTPYVVYQGAILAHTNGRTGPQFYSKQDRYLISASALPLGGAPLSVIGVCVPGPNMTSDFTNAEMVDYRPTGSTDADNPPNGALLACYNISSGAMAGWQGGAILSHTPIALSGSSPHQFDSIFTANTQTMSVDGVSGNTVACNALAATGTLVVGGNAISFATGRSWDNSILEIILPTGTVASADLTTIRNSQQAYYGTPVPGVVTVTYATSYTTSISPGAGLAGAAFTYTCTPTGGSWPTNETITPSVTNGTCSPTSGVGSGTTPVAFTITPSGSAGSTTTVNSTAPGMSNSTGAQNYSVRAPVVSNGSANRYDLVASASTATTSTSVTLTAYPNANWSGGTIPLTATKTGGGSVTVGTMTLPNSGSTPQTISWIPPSNGEWIINGANTAGMYDPYGAPLNVFNASSGTPQAISANSRFPDQTPHQRDTPSGNPTGFSLAWAKGWGEVWIDVTSIGGPTNALWCNLIDSDNTGTNLNSAPVQIYGAISGTGRIRVLLPAGPYWMNVQIATDQAMTYPITLSQRIGVGSAMLLNLRSSVGVFIESYPYGAQNGQYGYIDCGVNYSKAVGWWTTNPAYGEPSCGWFRHDGVSADNFNNHYGAFSSSGIMEFGRLHALQTGCIFGATGTAANGRPFDEFFGADGATVDPGAYDTWTYSLGAKARYYMCNANEWGGGWGGVGDANFHSSVYSEYHSRITKSVDWLARHYPSVAVQGLNYGSMIPCDYDRSGPERFGRLQAIALNELEPVNPMVVSLDGAVGNQTVDGAHSTMGTRILWTQAFFREFMAAEIAAFNGDQTAARGPTLSQTGTIASGSRVIRIPYKLDANGSGGLQSYVVQQNGLYDPGATWTSPATSTNLQSLFVVYTQGGMAPGGRSDWDANNGLSGAPQVGRIIRTAGVAINTSSPPSGYDGTIDITLYGASGVTYSDNTTDTMLSNFTVHYLCDMTLSGGDWGHFNGVSYVIAQAPTAQDDARGIKSGWHMRQQIDIAISTV